MKGSFKRLKLIDVPGAQHILEQIPPENWHESVEKGGLDLGGPNGRFKIHIGLFASGYPKYIIEYTRGNTKWPKEHVKDVFSREAICIFF